MLPLAVTVSFVISPASISILSPAPKFRIGVATAPMLSCSASVLAPLPKLTEAPTPLRSDRKAPFSRVKDWLPDTEMGVAAVPRLPPSMSIVPVPVTVSPSRLTLPVTTVLPELDRDAPMVTVPDSVSWPLLVRPAESVTVPARVIVPPLSMPDCAHSVPVCVSVPLLSTGAATVTAPVRVVVPALSRVVASSVPPVSA